MRISDWSSDVCSSDLSGGALSAYTVPSHAQPTCTNDGGLFGIAEHVDIRWNKAGDARVEYRWELRPAGTTTVSSSGTTGGGLANGAQITLEVLPGLIGFNGKFDVLILARVPSATSWVASSPPTDRER